MAFRASSSRINIQRQSSLREDNDDPALLGPLHVQRRRPGSQRIKRSGSSGRFERKGQYEACGTVKLLLAFPQADIVKPLEQAFLAEVFPGRHQCSPAVDDCKTPSFVLYLNTKTLIALTRSLDAVYSAVACDIGL